MLDEVGQPCFLICPKTYVHINKEAWYCAFVYNVYTPLIHILGLNIYQTQQSINELSDIFNIQLKKQTNE